MLKLPDFRAQSSPGNPGRSTNLPSIETRATRLSRTNPLAVPAQRWKLFAWKPQERLIQFDPSVLIRVGSRLRAALNTSLDCLRDLRSAVPAATFDHRPFERVFGSFGSEHSFRVDPITWGFRLTEPQVTKAPAHFLDQGPKELRARRIQAFLSALGTPIGANDGDLSKSVVQAEVDRIDLEIHVTTMNGRLRPILIEAKLGHVITERQLSDYRAKRSGVAFDESRRDCVILSLSETDRRGLKGRQVNIWRSVAWRDFWLRFEKSRPRDDNSQFPMFLHTLWQRIGGLTKENGGV